MQNVCTRNATDSNILFRVERLTEVRIKPCDYIKSTEVPRIAELLEVILTASPPLPQIVFLEFNCKTNVMFSYVNSPVLHTELHSDIDVVWCTCQHVPYINT